MPDEEDLKAKVNEKKGPRKLGTEEVEKAEKDKAKAEAKAEKAEKKARKTEPEVMVDPNAHLPVVFDKDLNQVGIALPEPEPFLEIPEGLSYPEWIAAAEQFKPLAAHLETGREVIRRYDDSIMWRLGDFMNYGEKMKKAGVEGYVEKYENALHGDDYGYSHDTLRNAMWVAEKIPPRERIATISFSHHKTVAKLEPGDRKRWLLRVEKEGWTVTELNRQMKGPTPAKKPAPAKTVEPLEFTSRDLEKSCETLYDLYEYMADLSTARKKDPDCEIDFAELDKRARAAAHMVSAVLVGIGEALKESEAA